jgi:glycosyltransferase involved in cell wall biosynthesis
MTNPILEQTGPEPAGRNTGVEGGGVDFSVVVPISERHDDLGDLYRAFGSELSRLGRSYEFIFVIDGEFRDAFEKLQRLKKENKSIRIIQFQKRLGEAAALSAGFSRATGKQIMTLSPYFQVEPAGLPGVIEALAHADLVITRRYPRSDPWFNRFQSRIFNGLTGWLTGIRYHDMTCGLRVMTREVAESLNLYGDLHRFIPVEAHKQGFKIVEIAIPQHPMDRAIRIRKPGVYLRRILDILTVFFLTKFTKKPLRFFGLIGSMLFIGGTLITLYLGLYRILGFGGIAERPLLLLGVLLMVLGVQLLSIGLIGEIVIFTHARQIKEYRIDEITD